MPSGQKRVRLNSMAAPIWDAADCANHAVETRIFENLITKDVLAKLLSLSVSYIDKLVREKKIPYYKI
ncbi:MAG: hypothetical protein RJB66_52, partial [Pseudomonadota bacterium]